MNQMENISDSLCSVSGQRECTEKGEISSGKGVKMVNVETYKC